MSCNDFKLMVEEALAIVLASKKWGNRPVKRLRPEILRLLSRRPMRFSEIYEALQNKFVGKNGNVGRISRSTISSAVRALSSEVCGGVSLIVEDDYGRYWLTPLAMYILKILDFLVKFPPTSLNIRAPLMTHYTPPTKEVLYIIAHRRQPPGFKTNSIEPSIVQQDLLYRLISLTTFQSLVLYLDVHRESQKVGLSFSPSSSTAIIWIPITLLDNDNKTLKNLIFSIISKTLFITDIIVSSIQLLHDQPIGLKEVMGTPCRYGGGMIRLHLNDTAGEGLTLNTGDLLGHCSGVEVYFYGRGWPGKLSIRGKGYVLIERRGGDINRKEIVYPSFMILPPASLGQSGKVSYEDSTSWGDHIDTGVSRGRGGGFNTKDDSFLRVADIIAEIFGIPFEKGAKNVRTELFYTDYEASLVRQGRQAGQEYTLELDQSVTWAALGYLRYGGGRR
ncbi:MAG: hypothetical protein F7C35_03270 [Desulfurococcales archaeon]|nr:hypothetical protein [Desulfurococcales archaeon]